MCEGYFNISIPSKGLGRALFDTVILLLETGIFVALGICEFRKLRGFLRTFFSVFGKVLFAFNFVVSFCFFFVVVDSCG